MALSNNKSKEILNKIGKAAHSSRGRDAILFIMFLGISYIFWLMLTLNNEIQEDFEVPVELTEIPDSITMLDEIPHKINVSVRGKGSALVRHKWGGLSPMKLQFRDYVSNNKFIMGKNDIDSKLRSFFGSGTQMISFSPDSIKSSFSSHAGLKVPLKIKTDINAHFQYVINGEIAADVDSVSLYSANDIPREIDHVETVPIIKYELKDTLRIVAKIKNVPGIKAIPDEVLVTIPVEPLISKKQTISITTINTPTGSELILFPSTVTLNYLVPMSQYNNSYTDTKVEADFNSTKSGNVKIPLYISNIPEFYQNITIAPDSVEYIIEQ